MSLTVKDGSGIARTLKTTTDGADLVTHTILNETADVNVTNTTLDVAIQDQYSEEINMYLQSDKLTTTLTAGVAIDDVSFDIDSVAGIIVGDAITISEGARIFQSIITDITTNTITIASPLDYAFTTASCVCIGAWNLNLNGSSTPITATFKTAPLSEYDIYQINITMTDGTAMDSAKFGGITALTNGVLFRHKNGVTKNLALVVNNLGFSEQGFDIQYDPKAPTGVYGIQAKKNYKTVSGVSIRTVGADSDELQFIIRDDLTDLSLLTVSVQGHVVE